GIRVASSERVVSIGDVVCRTECSGVCKYYIHSTHCLVLSGVALSSPVWDFLAICWTHLHHDSLHCILELIPDTKQVAIEEVYLIFENHWFWNIVGKPGRIYNWN
ncbi:hypothetical protein LINPERHAP2_LOCUS4702, partial [Linum perenne]